ncbi:hypothetical protein PCYB_007810, partial [Plasmodium cynomolgi strain B]
YPFLSRVWDTYNKFDKSVETTDEGYSNYVNVCETKAKNYIDTSNHKDFCMKLVRNLGCYSFDRTYSQLYDDDCIILYYWIYNSVKQHNINNKLITAIFYDNYSKACTYLRRAKCFYYDFYYDMFEEPVYMVFLEIFRDNIYTIINTLKSEDKETNDKLQEYACNCIHIYKKMNDKYCVKKHYDDQKSSLTCSILRAFKQTYDSYFARELYNKTHIIPDIDD